MRWGGLEVGAHVHAVGLPKAIAPARVRPAIGAAEPSAVDGSGARCGAARSDSDDKTPAASPKSSKPDVSADGSFDPNSLSVAQLGQCAKLIAGFQVVSTAEADTSPKDTTKASEESAPVSHGNVVKRLMGMFDSNQVDPSHIVANSSAANAACHMAGEVTLDGVYVPK